MDEGTVRRVAKVSRLDLTDDEVSIYAADLEDILSAFAVLDEAPTGEDFDLDPVPVEDRLRDDEVMAYPDPGRLRREMRTADGWVRGPRLA
jgi:aspartyl-tRNA(Asn)/glutamyl-tRNA(Gln) amidotransferase subunit C